MLSKRTDTTKALLDKVNMRHTWNLDMEHHTEGAAGWSGVCLLINLVFSLNKGEAQEVIKQGGKGTRSIVMGRLFGRMLHCFPVKCVCIVTGKAQSDHTCLN